MHYLFTVILPVFQVKEYLTQCLDSFVDDCGEDVQILLVDDGSTDGSLEICRRYAAANSRIQVISQENGGVSKARNTGLSNAKGEYLVWVDPDDWVEPDWLLSIRQVVEAHKPDMLIFDYQEVQNQRFTSCFYRECSQKLSVSQVLTDLTDDTKLRSVLWNKVIRRAFFEQQRFDECLRCMEDADMLCRLVPKMERIEYLHKVLYTYRIRSNGLVQKPDLPTAFRCFELALERETSIRQMGVPVSPLGTWLQAKGFLCKYYRAGIPENWQNQYQRCRQYLAAAKKEILCQPGLNIKDRLKYLFIGNAVVGAGYRLLKELQNKAGEKHV